MSKYWPLNAIIIVFIIPFVSALYVLYIQPINFSNVANGTFMPPEKIYAVDQTTHKWKIISLGQQRQDILKNLHRALGANQERVLLKFSSPEEINLKLPVDSIIIIDPQGYAVMHYPPEINLSLVLKDLRRLLKYSHAK